MFVLSLILVIASSIIGSSLLALISSLLELIISKTFALQACRFSRSSPQEGVPLIENHTQIMKQEKAWLDQPDKQCA